MNEEKLNQADALYERKKYKRAASLYREILNLEPDNARAHQQLARCLLHLRQHSDATMEARKALSLDAQLSAPHAVLGYIHIQKRELEEAATLYRRALELEPQNPRYSGTLAWILASQGKYQEGLEILRPFERLAHKEPSIHQALSFIYKKQNLKRQANQEAWKAFKLAPSFFTITWLLGIQLENNPIALITFVVLFFTFFIVPISISYSIPAILISVIASLVLFSMIASRIYGIVRSERKNKSALIALALLILLFYSYSLYSHWTQPMISSETVQVKVSIAEVKVQPQTLTLEFFYSPPFFKLVPVYSAGIRVTVNNHLDDAIMCSITDQEKIYLFAYYQELASFEALPGESIQEITAELPSSAKIWWVRCGNDLSSVAIPLDLSSYP